MIEGLGREVQVVLAPVQRSVVGGHLGEASRIAKRREDAWPIVASEGDITDSAIFKQQPQLVVADHDHPLDVHKRKNLRLHVCGC